MRCLMAGWLLALASLTATADEGQCLTCVDEPALSVEATYSAETWRSASSSVRTGGRYLDNLDLAVLLDGRLFGVERLTLFGNVLYNNGQGLTNELAGAAQGVSNIETARALRLYELWGEWRFGERHSLRAGLYDLNSEFDTIEAAGLFIQPSQGIGADLAQSGENGPSIFPVTSLALRAKHTIGSWSLQAAVLDAVPGDPEHPRRTSIELSRREGALLVAEIGRKFAGLRITTGYWRYTASFADLRSQATSRTDNAGAYVFVASPKLFTSNGGDGLDLYLRAGRAESRVNPIGQYIGAGAVYSGLFADDDSDQVGLSVAIADLGAPFRRMQADAGMATTSREYAWELTYRWNATHWLTVQPDVQYIRHPGMDPQRTASWMLGVRFDFSRAWER